MAFGETGFTVKWFNSSTTTAVDNVVRIKERYEPEVLSSTHLKNDGRLLEGSFAP